MESLTPQDLRCPGSVSRGGRGFWKECRNWPGEAEPYLNLFSQTSSESHSLPGTWPHTLYASSHLMEALE